MSVIRRPCIHSRFAGLDYYRELLVFAVYMDQIDSDVLSPLENTTGQFGSRARNL